jgi:hypothetical protein
MRPKFVLAVLVLAVVTLGLFVIVKGLGTRQPGPVLSADATNAEPVTAATNHVEPPMTNIVATTPAEDSQARIEKEQEALNEALLAGPEDPNSLTTVAGRLVSPDAEVRRAAVTTAVHLGDTNIIPYLTAALATTEDPHEKAAILDALEYLKLPRGDEAQSDAMNTNPVPSVTPRPGVRPRPAPTGAK